MLKFLLDILFPVFCLGCRTEGLWLCQNCQKQIRFNRHFICPICKNSLDGCLVALSYEQELVRELIRVFKYKYILDLKEILSGFLIDFLKKVQNKKIGFQYIIKKDGSAEAVAGQVKVPEIFLKADQAILIPVPLHKKRLADRGYNQSDLLAEDLSKSFGFELNKNLLVRHKNTRAQARLKKEERLVNVVDAFECPRPEAVKGLNIILVDDIYTTGATIGECAKVLKEAGAGEVWGIVLARGQ